MKNVVVSRVMVVIEAWDNDGPGIALTSQLLEIREPVLDFTTRLKRQETDNHLVSVYILDQRVE